MVPLPGSGAPWHEGPLQAMRRRGKTPDRKETTGIVRSIADGSVQVPHSEPPEPAAPSSSAASLPHPGKPRPTRPAAMFTAMIRLENIEDVVGGRHSNIIRVRLPARPMLMRRTMLLGRLALVI